MSKVLKRINGFLSKDDLDLLEQASTRMPKYKKTQVHSWLCRSCHYQWFYKSVKCPVCESKQIKEEVNNTR